MVWFNWRSPHGKIIDLFLKHLFQPVQIAIKGNWKPNRPLTNLIYIIFHDPRNMDCGTDIDSIHWQNIGSFIKFVAMELMLIISYQSNFAMMIYIGLTERLYRGRNIRRENMFGGNIITCIWTRSICSRLIQKSNVLQLWIYEFPLKLGTSYRTHNSAYLVKIGCRDFVENAITNRTNWMRVDAVLIGSEYRRSIIKSDVAL